ncbi:MAG: cbb3-type cytochrome c oxidase subunit 3 [Bdellovibrionales bacterium]
MKSLGLSFFTDTHWTLVGLIIFFVSFFVLIRLHFYILGHGREEYMTRLPFEGDEHGQKK